MPGDAARALRAVALSACAALVACDVEPYHISGAFDDGGGSVGDGGGRHDAGAVGDAAPAMDGATDAAPCTPAPEVCDGRDNDCDGDVDEDFNLMADPANCGACGNACDRPQSAGTCAAGVCEFDCLPGWLDLDGDTGNGCEYLCSPTGAEVCDGRDNDCDGDVDEDFDLDNSVDNCGACGNRCAPLHAVPDCSSGTCGFSECEPGFADVLPGVPGCEYSCPVWPPVAETCNGVDDDCDGVVDEAPIAGLGEPCPPPGYESVGDTGECAFGATACSFGVVVCTGYVGPSVEVCDGLDNDCNGVADNGFDTDNDPNHCGPGCSVCAFPNAIPACTGGVCTIAACQNGFVDADGELANGCEYACSPTGPEVCDGIDNDCDRLVDTEDPDLAPVPNFCATKGACAGTAPVCAASPCDSTVTWRCLYGPPAEVDACGNLRTNESVCDGVDGDCDGNIDESFALVGTPCDDGLLGECRGTGTYVCNAAGDGVECAITKPGAAPEPAETACDGRDEDCDGQVDEGAPDTMVHVTAGGLDFWIDAYEASRPDATPSSSGSAEHRACSNPGVKPWRSVTWSQAAAACAAAGKRLCTEAEWQAACEGPSATAYPYGDAYAPNACNGDDYDPDCAPPDDDVCLPSGTAYGCPPPASSACVSAFGAFDLSGNVKEWTATQVSASPVAYRIRGGAYDSVASGLTCQFDFVSGSDTFSFPNLGFRCCADTAP